MSIPFRIHIPFCEATDKTDCRAVMVSACGKSPCYSPSLLLLSPLQTSDAA